MTAKEAARDVHYWRNAYEELVRQTGRDLNDGLGPDPRKSAADAPAAKEAETYLKDGFKITLPKSGDVLTRHGRYWDCAAPSGAVATNEEDWEIVDQYGLDALVQAVLISLSAAPPLKPIGDGLVDREVVARVIDPIAFKSRAAMLAYCMREGEDAETAQRYADDTHGPDIAKALNKADEIITLLGGRSDSSARSHPEALRTMTITLTDAEMVAMEQMIAQTAMQPRTIFRHALASYQLKLHEAAHGPVRDDRMPDYPSEQRQGVLHSAPDPESMLHGAHTESGGAGS